MEEKRSETKIIWVVIALLGAQLLGVDLQQVLAVLGGLQQHADVVGQALPTVQTTNGSSNIALPVLAAIYAYLRTDIKKRRESGSNQPLKDAQQQ